MFKFLCLISLSVRDKLPYKMAIWFQRRHCASCILSLLSFGVDGISTSVETATWVARSRKERRSRGHLCYSAGRRTSLDGVRRRQSNVGREDVDASLLCWVSARDDDDDSVTICLRVVVVRTVTPVCGRYNIRTDVSIKSRVHLKRIFHHHVIDNETQDRRPVSRRSGCLGTWKKSKIVKKMTYLHEPTSSKSLQIATPKKTAVCRPIQSLLKRLK